jgi:hypothetical protein
MSRPATCYVCMTACLAHLICACLYLCAFARSGHPMHVCRPLLH